MYISISSLLLLTHKNAKWQWLKISGNINDISYSYKALPFSKAAKGDISEF